MKLKSNLKVHELIGLVMVFLSGSLLGLGLYLTFWGANRPLLFEDINKLLSGKEYIIFPMFYGLSFILWSLGQIELKEARPGRKR